MNIKSWIGYNEWVQDVLHNDCGTCRFPGCHSRASMVYCLDMNKNSKHEILAVSNGVSLCKEHFNIVKDNSKLYVAGFKS